MYYPLHIPTNRHDRRQMDIESKKIMSFLSPIEDLMIAQIFRAEGMDYATLYRYYSGIYSDMILGMKKGIRLKYLTVNEYYFKETYSPIEREYN